SYTNLLCAEVYVTIRICTEHRCCQCTCHGHRRKLEHVNSSQISDGQIIVSRTIQAP
ncbi:hypothetical protein BDZ97DRAFT_1784895, partial [Flammula alnicola]